MKKYFFYAAMALTMMSSCSKDNDVTEVNNPDMPNDEAPVAIELGLSAPQAIVTTRGMGTVGGIVDADNFWNGQELHVVMYNKGTATKTTEGDPATYIFEGLTFKAPTQTTDNKTNTTIQILKDASTIQAKYYPSTGAYDFYGYHVDDAGGTLSDGAKTVTGIVIDGTQDLMAAKTKEVIEDSYQTEWGKLEESDKTLVADRAFSAWTARRDIQPILVFKHLLTRLQFNVIAGQEDAAINKYEGSGFTSNPTIGATEGAEEGQSTAVYIESIQVTGVKYKDITIDLDNQTATTEDATTTEFILMQRPESGGELENLTPTAPKAWAPADGNYNEENPKKTPVGESIMLLPNETTLNLKIKVSQWVVDTEGLDGTNKKYVKRSEDLEVEIDASTIQNSTTQTDNKKFLPGESYNINITVYSFQRIEVSAELTNWTAGGDIDIAPGDQF